MENYSVNKISYEDTKPFIMNIHYAKRMPSISYSFGLFSIIVSYADTSQNHHGYIYQATNFIYTGLSDKRTEWRMRNSNQHSKTISEKYSLEERKNNPNKFYIIDRPQKHRYIYIVANKKDKKNLLKKLKYKISPYPKGENKNYETDNNINTQFMLFD